MLERLRRKLKLILEIDVIAEQQQQLFSKLEKIDERLSTVEFAIDEMIEDFALKEELYALKHDVKLLHRDILEAKHFLHAKLENARFSKLEMIEQSIIDVLKRKEELPISELRSLVQASWNDLYEAIKHLERQKIISRERKGKKVFVKLRTV